MTAPFEDLPTTPRADELLDKAFSRAARSGRAKSGHEAQESMLRTAANILSDNLENVVVAWPDFDAIDPFYYELADALVGVGDLRGHLATVNWGSRQAEEIRDEYMGRIRTADHETARKLRKQAFARLADVLDDVGDALLAIGDARETLRTLPEIRPEVPTVVVAGYPNVGKTSFVNAVTHAGTEVAAYPFTTTQVHLGHVERDHITYQIVDTPGLLDRPPEERNDIETQAASALSHLADCVLFFVDASGECGYPVGDQLALREAILEQFDDVPVLTVCNKADRSTEVEADYYTSVTDGHGVEAVLAAAIDAVGYQPGLPFEEENRAD